LDELLDFGYPQTTDSKILQEWVAKQIIQSCNDQLFIFKLLIIY
jgi:hypothetical protein